MTILGKCGLFARRSAAPILGAAISLGLAGSLHASLLVYEGFNGYTPGGNLSSFAPNGNTIGLDTTTTYSGSGVSGYAISSAGLAFGALATSGGSVTDTGGTAVGAAKLNLGSAVSGSLYSSYLVNFGAAQSTATGAGAETRVSDNNTTGGERFITAADDRNTAMTTDGAAYVGTTVTDGSVTLTPGTTYLMIERLTNVGTTLSTTTTGQATQYALTAAQFASFKAAGGTDAYLDGASIGSAASNVTDRVSTPALTSSSYNFTTGNYESLVTVSDTATYDELRFGTTLADVTPTTPEPASAALVLLASLAMLARRRSDRGAEDKA